MLWYEVLVYSIAGNVFGKVGNVAKVVEGGERTRLWVLGVLWMFALSSGKLQNRSVGATLFPKRRKAPKESDSRLRLQYRAMRVILRNRMKWGRKRDPLVALPDPDVARASVTRGAGYFPK